MVSARSLRERRALTQEGLAEAAGVHPVTVYRLEMGVRTSADTRRRIARVLGVPPEELYVVHDATEYDTPGGGNGEPGGGASSAKSHPTAATRG